MKRLAFSWLASVAACALLLQRAAAQDLPETAAPAVEAPTTPANSLETAAAPAPEAPVAQSAEPAVTAESAASEDALMTAELAKLGLSEAGDDAATIDDGLKLSGFADFSVLGLLVPKRSPWRGTYERYPAFSIGNFNLYLSKNLSSSLRMFGEVRFTFLPNGSSGALTGSPTGEYVSTLAQDYADTRRPLRWAGIEIERVYLEWVAHRALVVRAGVFLTPYGIWNVDHGSPTVITPQRPFIVGQELFPERQTGIEVLGQFDVSAHNTFGYHATLSNGTGPVSEYRDFDGNKALGARAYWSYDGFGALRVGASAYYGTDTAAREVPSIASDGKHIEYSQHITSKSDLLSLAADVQWKFKGLLVQSELITQQRRFDERGRIGAVNPLLGQYIAPIDKVSWGMYGLIGYRFQWFGVMPYLLVQTMRTNDPVNAILLDVNQWEVGLNIRPIDVLVVKLDLQEGHFPNDSLGGNTPIRFGQLQVAWAF
jgi:hypothetical protein